MKTVLKDDGLELSAPHFRRFAEFITRELGIRMGEGKIPMLKSRLMRRLRALGLHTLEEYQDVLFDPVAGAAELADFIDAVTTNKTDFFREPHHFDYLTSTALPALDPGAEAPFRCQVWCAGCSSGEETYTLAMVLGEFAVTRPGFDFRILGTDISTRVLRHAQGAIYAEERITPVAPMLRKKYLLRSRDPQRRIVRIAPVLRARARFQRLNFMAEDYAVRETFDAIFFRNVMIYFDKATQQTVIEKLCRNLRPGGFLFVGHSESLVGLDLPLKLVASAVYRRP